jgi:tetratricopeptide (TPR) repeat protein
MKQKKPSRCPGSAGVTPSPAKGEASGAADLQGASRRRAPQDSSDTSRKREGSANGLPGIGVLRRSPVWFLLAPACLLLAAAMVYSNTFSTPFLFDGKTSVRDHPLWHKAWPPWDCLKATLRPLATWSVNFAIHVLAAWVLYGIVWRTLLWPGWRERYGDRARWLALAAALLWVVHPLQTQSVTYIYQRYESLMGLFFLLSVYAFIRGAQGPRTRHAPRDEDPHAERGEYMEGEPSRRWGWYGLSIVCCLASLASKEVGGMIPLVILWYDRVFVAHSWREVLRQRGPYYGALAGVFLLLGAVVLLHVGFYQGGGLLYWNEISPWHYALSQPGVILHYLQLCFWPQGQCLDYHWPLAKSVVDILPQGVAIGALLGLTVASMFRWPSWGFLGGVFFLILAPTSSFLPIVDLAFEHRMYLPLAAVAVAVVLAVDELPRRWGWEASRRRRYDRWSMAALAVVLVALGLTTLARNRVYASEVAMWSDVVRKAPANPHGYTNLAVALVVEKRDFPRARICCHEAIRLAPYLSDPYRIMGDLAATPQEAAGWYRRALKNYPDDAYAANNFGLSLLYLEQTDEAIRQFRTAVKINPYSSKYHKNLSTALARQGNFEAALAEFRVACQWQPSVASPPLASWMRGRGIKP